MRYFQSLAVLGSIAALTAGSLGHLDAQEPPPEKPEVVPPVLDDPDVPPPPTAPVGPDPYYGYSGFGPYQGPYVHHASTPAGSYFRGFADVVRSAGDYNLKSSQALENIEEARREYIYNRLLATDTWFKRKQLNAYYQAQMRRPPPTAEQAAQYAEARAPEKLEYRQLDPATGEIIWPMLLQEETFDRARRYLDHAFAQNAQEGAWSAEEQIHALNAVRVMMRQLQSLVKDVPTEQYVPARNFLESLEYEVRLRLS